MYLESITDASERLSGKLPPRKIAQHPPLPIRVRVWFRIRVRIRAGGGGGNFHRGNFTITIIKMPIKKNNE